jgi:polyhydroxyalkanoate synthesis regulator phasin
MSRKQIVLNFTEWDEETFGMLQQTYPHKKDADILRELMFQWRLRHENNDTKEDKLTMIVHLVNELAEEVGKLREEVTELRRELSELKSK